MPTVYRSPLILSKGAALGADRYFAFGLSEANANTTLANRETLIKQDGWIDKLRGYVSANASSSGTDLTVLVNGVASDLTVNIPAGFTGFFEELSLFDTVAVDDLVTIFMDKNDANSITFKHLGCDYLTETAASVLVGTGGFSMSTSALTRYIRINGAQAVTIADDNNTRQYVPCNCTAKRARIYVSANSKSSDSTMTLKTQSGLTALVLTISAGTTGWIETATEVSLSAGDTINWEATWPAGGTVSVQTTVIELEGDNAGEVPILSCHSNVGMSANATRYIQSVAGIVSTQETTETPAQITIFGSGTISDFYSVLLTNTSTGTTSFTFRTNAADEAVTLTHAASTAGMQSDTTNSFTFADGDLSAVKVIRASGTGSVTLSSMSFLITMDGEDSPVAPVSGAKSIIMMWW